MFVPVNDLRPGDVFVADGRDVWTAIGDPYTVVRSEGPAQFRDAVAVDVRFCADGGLSTREWADGRHELLVRRPA